MERALKGFAVVLLLCAALWLLVQATRKNEVPAAAVTAPPAAVKPMKFQEGERAVSAIPPIKLIREKRSVKRTEPSVPVPSEGK